MINKIQIIINKQIKIINQDRIKSTILNNNNPILKINNKVI